MKYYFILNNMYFFSKLKLIITINRPQLQVYVYTKRFEKNIDIRHSTSQRVTWQQSSLLNISKDDNKKK